jgi:hypothetical protein
MSQNTLQKPGNKERVSEIAKSKRSRIYRLIINIYIIFLFPYFCTFFYLCFYPYFPDYVSLDKKEVGIRCVVFNGNTRQ